MISIAHQALTRGRRRVLEAGELRLPVGATVGLVGANGAGKSSLMMAIAGVLAASEVHFRDAPRPRIGYLPQRPTAPAWLDGEAIVRLYGLDPGDFLREHGDFDVAELLGRRFGNCSPGQQQILCALLVLTQGCPLTLLDEPLSALDIRRRRQLIERIRSRPPDRTVVISSQVAADLEDTCTHVIVIGGGRYVFEGSVAELVGGENAGMSRRERFEREILRLIS